jgi:mxaJ protein
MSSPCRSALGCLLFLLAAPAFAADLRICADPNNLPFSNRAQKGFENRIAEMVANDLHQKLQYVWWSERKNCIENSLNAGRCDVVMGVPSELGSAAVTQPYYRSTYVVVSRRASRSPAISSLNDERLAALRIGIHVVDSDYAPPAQLLASRGLSANLVGFSLYGKPDEPNPPARLVDAVTHGEIDVAIVWGPLAGYFATDKSLELAPVNPPRFRATPFIYAIGAAVRKGDETLRTRINDSLTHQCPAIQTLLAEYRVPQVSGGQPPCASAQPVYALSR